MPNLNSTVDLDFKKFLRWWSRELNFLVPEKLKRLVNDKKGFIIISPVNSQLVLNYLDDPEKQPKYLATIDRNELGVTQVNALLENDESLAKANVILRLSSQDALQKQLSFPVAAKENLNQVVAYELDRYTPFKADQAYFALKQVSVGNEPGQIQIQLILTIREFLDGVYEDLKTLNLIPLFADYENVPNDLDNLHDAYDLLPEKLRQKATKTPRLVPALIASGILLLATALVLPVYLEYQTVEALAEKVQIIEKDAKKIKALQSEVDAVINETQKLIDEKNATPPVIEILNTLSTIIKDDTSLAFLQYSDKHLQIQGESPAASTLIGILEESDLFTKVRFVSPVTQNTISKLERFQITFDVTKPGDKGDKTGNP